MARLTVPVSGYLIDKIASDGFGFIRVGIDIPNCPSVNTELELEDISGDRSPIECVVTGVKSNSDARIPNGGTAILKVRCSGVDVDDRIESEAISGAAGMDFDFAAVDSWLAASIPGSLTPTGACQLACQGEAQAASYGPVCTGTCQLACQGTCVTVTQNGKEISCLNSCQAFSQGGKGGVQSCNIACQAEAEAGRSGLPPPPGGCAKTCESASQARQKLGAPAGLLKETDTSSLKDGALWVWDRRYWSKLGQRS